MPMLPLRLWTTERSLADLYARLDAARWPLVPAARPGSGADDQRLRALVRRWRFAFDWPACVAHWNRYAHVRGPVGAEGTAELHALLAAPDLAAPDLAAADLAVAGGRSRERPAVVLLPAWPGGVPTALPLVDALVAAGYEVVLPSLPGTGYSDPPRTAAFTARDGAVQLAGLLAHLGHRRVVVHAEAETAVLAAHLAALGGASDGEAGAAPPVRVRGVYLVGDPTTAEVGAAADGRAALVAAEPATLGYALHDSPLGLLAWLQPWADRRGMPDEAICALATWQWMTGGARDGLFAAAWAAEPAPPLPAQTLRAPAPRADGAAGLLAFLDGVEV